MPGSHKRMLGVFPILAALGLLLSAAFTARGKANVQTQITILHTNDTHAHLESFTTFDGILQGGVARRYTAIQQVKAEGGNVLLLDAGDAFQGTLFFNAWEGEEEAYFMNALGYQAMAVGNHEFYKGPATLADFVNLANFPVLSANMDASAEPSLAGLIPAYTGLNVAGEQIGVVGLITEETPFISPDVGPNVVFNDHITTAQATVAELEGMGINKIIALSHLGYDPDQALAAAVDGIDVIVGGHSHTLLGSMEGAQGPYPTVVNSPSGHPVLIVSAQDWGRYLGRLDVTFSADGNVFSYSGEPIFIDESVAEDPTIAADVATFNRPIAELLYTPIGQSAVDLEGTRELVRSQETNLGNLICDALLWKTAAENTQICIMNGGGIRASIPAGDVTMQQLLVVLPYSNRIATFGLTGADVWAALENGVSQYETAHGRFPQVGGLKYVFDPSLEPGSRIVSVQVKNAHGTYEPIDSQVVYKLASNDYMRAGGDDYAVFVHNAIAPYDFGAVLSDALAEYITAHSPVSPVVEGRITQPSTPTPTPTPTTAPTPGPLTHTLYLPIILRGYTPWQCSEPGNNLRQGACGPLMSATVYQEYLSAASDEFDWFYFDLPTATAIEAWLTDIPQECDYDLYLRESGGAHVISSAEPRNEDEHIGWGPLPAGRYYLVVVQIAGWNASLPYALRVDF